MSTIDIRMWNYYVLLCIAVIGVCSECLLPCNSCSGQSSNCVNCISGYYLQNNECLNCSQVCLECNSSTMCTLCTPGYYLNASFCYLCRPACQQCTSLSSCTSCVSGYYMNSGYCYLCNKSCSICTSLANCTSCNSGYYYNEVNSECKKCPNNCSSCQNEKTCTNCSDGYYLMSLDDSNILCSSCAQFMCIPQDATESSSTTSAASHTTNQSRIASTDTVNPVSTRNLPSSKTPSATKISGIPADQTTSSIRATISRVTTKFDTFDNFTNTNSEHKMADSGTTLKVTPIIAGAVGGAVAIGVIIIVVIVLIRNRIRTSEPTGGTIDNYFNSAMSYSYTRQATEQEAGPVYSTHNKVKVRSSSNRNAQARKSQVPVNYENTSLGPGPPLKITAYLDDDLMEEADGSDSDPTGGRVEGLYDTYYNTSKLFRHHVTVETLAEFVAKKSIFDYETEFKKFPNGLARNYEKALKKENAKKNRYKQVYPYDATRVVLEDGDDGDYINASYISDQLLLTPRDSLCSGEWFGRRMLTR